MAKKIRKKHWATKNKRAKAKRRLRIITATTFIFTLLVTAFFLKEKLKYLLYIHIKKHDAKELVNSKKEQTRIDRIITANAGQTFGIDLSHYQHSEDIHWDSLSIGKGAIPIKFVMMRATMGSKRKDKNFEDFWQKAKTAKLLRGAYLYYRTDEDPIRQANNYLETVHPEVGDFVPIIDIERIPRKKTKENLIADLTIISKIFMQTYGKKPIIYTYSYYYKDYLRDDFPGYPIWLANYNDTDQPGENKDWQIWQFTENGIISGIDAKVDIDIFNDKDFYINDLLIDNNR